MKIERKPVMLVVSNDAPQAYQMFEWFNCFADVIAATTYGNARWILDAKMVDLIVIDGYGDEMASAFKFKYPQATVCLLTNDYDLIVRKNVHYIAKPGDKKLMLACILGVWLSEQKELLGHFQPLADYKDLLVVTRRESTVGMEALSMALQHDPSTKFLSSVCRIREHGERANIYVALMSGCYGGCRMCYVKEMKPTRSFSSEMMLSQISHLRTSYLCHGICNKADELSIKYFDGGDPIYCWKELCRTINTVDATGINARHTVCTTGNHEIISNIAKEVRGSKVEIEISGHSTDEKFRNWLIPQSVGTNLEYMVNELAEYSVRTGNKVALRHMVTSGPNRTEKEADGIARLLSGLPIEVKVMSVVDGTLPEFPGKVTRKNCDDFVAWLRERAVNASYKENLGHDFGIKMGTQLPICKRRELKNF